MSHIPKGMPRQTRGAPLFSGSIATADQLGGVLASLALSNGLPIWTATGDYDPRLIDLLVDTVASARNVPGGPRPKAMGRPQEAPRLVVRTRRDSRRNDGMIYCRFGGKETSTGFRESERDRAEAWLVLREQERRAEIAGYVVPTNVAVAEVVGYALGAYRHEPKAAKAKSAKGAAKALKGPKKKKKAETGRKKKLSYATFLTYVYKLDKIMLHFGGMRLGEVTDESCQDYLEMRQEMPGRGIDRDGSRNCTSVSTVRGELSHFKSAINLFADAKQLNWRPKIWMPPKNLGRATWLKRSEIARLLLSTRGWRWGDGQWATTTVWDPSDWTTSVDPKTGKWRSVATPGGSWVERPVVDRAVKKRMAPMARLIMMALYTGSRHQVLVDVRWTRNGVDGWVDFERNLFRRSDVGKPNTRKRCGPCRMPRRLRCKLEIWREADRRRGLDGYVVRAPRGGYFKRLPTDRIREVVLRAGMRFMGWSDEDKRFFNEREGTCVNLSLHAFRHTCATWMCEMGVPWQTAANFLSMEARTLTKVYEHSTDTHQGGTDQSGTFYGGAEDAIDLADRFGNRLRF